MDPHNTLAGIIGAIGGADFTGHAARALAAMTGFDRATAFLHRRGAASLPLFDDFDGGGVGIQNYARHTHRLNPMLARSSGAFRAADFALAGDPRLSPFLVRAPEEELGFRTIGWPQRLEEIGLYFQACGGIVELSFYRPRGRTGFGALAELEMLRAPVAAAFARHWALRAPLDTGALTPREAGIVRLLLAGCSSQTIALRLDISRHTVKDHRKRIFRKLGIGALSELFALERGH